MWKLTVRSPVRFYKKAALRVRLEAPNGQRRVVATVFQLAAKGQSYNPLVWKVVLV